MIGQVIVALAVSFLMALVLTPALLPSLRRAGGQRIRADGPDRHLRKAGTPTMGGLVFIPAATVGVIVSGGFSQETAVVLAVAAAFGAIGYLDDRAKVVLKRSLGLKARTKIGLSIVIGLALSYYATSLGYSPGVLVPFVGEVYLGALYVPFVVTVLLATTNAVNLTDGLDGLAAGLTAVACAGFVVLLWIGNTSVLMPVAAAVGGVCLGFLPMNRHPAAVFMGDTGSLALGGALAAIAVLSRMEVLLIVIGGVFVFETVSVIAQVFAFRVFGKRVWRMAPFHHHLELSGWSEQQIVKRLVCVGAVLAALGIVLGTAMRGVT